MPALAEVTVAVPFAGGIETKMDPKAVPSVRLLALKNAVFRKAVSLAKRNGYESLGMAVLGSTAAYRLPRGLAARGNELVLFTEDGPYSYVEGASAWSPIADGCMSIRQSDRALVKTISSQTGCDYAEASGVALVAWLDSRGGVYYAVCEADRGRTIIAPTQASTTGTRPRCVRSGDRLILLWAEGSLLKRIVVDPAGPHDVDGPAVVVDDLVAALPNFDAVYAPDENQSGAALAWSAIAGVRVAWLTPQGAVGSIGTGWAGAVTFATTGALTAGPAIGASSSDPSTWAIAWGVGPDAFAVVVNSSSQGPDPVEESFAPTSEAAGPTSIDRIAVGHRGTVLDVWCEERESTVRNSYVAHWTVTNAGVWSAAAPAIFRGACLASSAWTDAPTGGTPRGFVTLLHPAQLFPVYLAVRDDGLLVAQTIPTNAGEPPGHSLPRVTDPAGDRTWTWCAIYRNRLALNPNSVGFFGSGAVATDDVFTDAGPRLVRLDFNAADAYQHANLGRTMYVGGAITAAYDGVGFVEAAFPYAPDWETGAVLHSASTAGTGGLTSGTRSYVFWYQATLANGEVIRGPVSKPYVVTNISGDDRITLSPPTLRIGAWGRDGGAREDCQIVAARTRDGDAAAYYRITSHDPLTAGSANGYAANSQAVDAITIIDELSDANLVLREPAYFTDGIPSNDPLATSGVIAEAGGRLFVGDSSAGNRIFHSQERAEGYAAEFTPELRIEIPDATGDVTAIAPNGDAKAICTGEAIYRVTGPGPLANPAAGGGWTTPERVPSDVGCIDQRTAVPTSDGVMFNSAQGIRLLARDWQVSYIGAPVEAFNSQTYVRATAIADATEVRFLAAAGESLLYDRFARQWSTFTDHAGLDAAVVNGTYHYLRADGRVFRETAGEHADADASIPMVIETAKLKLRDVVQGLQMIWFACIVGTWRSAHTLRIQWATDLDAEGNWSSPVEFDATDMGGTAYGAGNYGAGPWGGSQPEPYEFQVHVSLMCEWIAFRISFVEPAGSIGACAELTELLITGGVAGQRNLLPDSRMG